MVAAWILCAAIARAEDSQSARANTVIVVGSTSDNYPYGYVGPDGEWTGFAKDVFDAVARVMHIRYRRVGAAGNELQARFRSGEFDALQALSQTDDREEYADFSVPYLTLQATLFVREQNNPIKKLEDLNGRNFAVTGVGSLAEKFLRDHAIKIKPVYVSSSEEALKLLSEGRCDGVFVSSLTALSVMERSHIKGVQMFGEPLPGYEIRHCFAVRNGDAALLAKLNEGLAILSRSGEYDKIYRHWFGRFDSPVFTRDQVRAYVAGALGLAFLAAVWGLLRQRSLLKRIAAQTALISENEALLHALYDNIPMVMCVFAQEGDDNRLISINRQASAQLGLTPDQAAGKLLVDLPLEPDWASLLKELLKSWPSPEQPILSEEYRLPGIKKDYAVTCLPLIADSTGRARLCVLADDVTQRRRMDEEIAQSRRLRAVGELVGGIAHEFNNLMTPVMLKLGEIQLDWASDLRLQQETGVIQQAINRAAELTRRLLAFGRKSESRAEEVRVETVVTASFELLRQTVDRRIALQNAVTPNLPPLFINLTNLHQVLLNLLLNARDTIMDKLAKQDSTGWSPTIRVELTALPADAFSVPNSRRPRPPRGWQRLTVRDNGLGMTPEIRERIFEPFYTTKEVGRGSGLGLATVWHIVTEAGGHIDVESTPGVGSSFHVTLPVWPVPEGKRPAPKPVPAAAGRKMKVFLAEDENLVANTLSRALERMGHHVNHVADGATAWAHLRDNMAEYGLLVFDVNMPGLSGIELVKRVRAAGRYHGRIMIVSGRLTSLELEEVAQLNVDGILNKPFSVEELQGAVGKL